MAGREDNPAVPRPEEHCILVVDDHEDNVELLRARLEARGYRVATAMDGEEALQQVESQRPDLILLDVMMPKIDGIEVARRVKSNADLPFIPIIMQTALDSTADKVEGLDAGADDYITKPINFAELEARVRSLLRIKALQEQVERQRAELSEINDRLLTISRTDGLTGLDNRRHIEERLTEFWGHSERLGESLSVVLCDLDKFKSVNDTYGHQAGDAVLKQFAAILKEQAREIDRVGRFGGEEFMLLLPGTVLDAAVTFAERVREAVEAHTFTFDGGTLTRTASFGVAGWPHPKVTGCDSLVRAADDALYVAKETGRNKVVRFDSHEFNAHVQAEEAAAPGGASPSAPPPDGAQPDADVTQRALPVERDAAGERGAGGGAGSAAGASDGAPAGA